MKTFSIIINVLHISVAFIHIFIYIFSRILVDVRNSIVLVKLIIIILLQENSVYISAFWVPLKIHKFYAYIQKNYIKCFGENKNAMIMVIRQAKGICYAQKLNMRHG